MKFFVTSDIHSFYQPLKEALDTAGFDSSNEEHWLVVCGDCFDRGPESEELLHYLMSLERKILVKGNHDILLEECCVRGFPYGYDSSNGTRRTIQDIGGDEKGNSFGICCQNTYNKTAAYRDSLVNYFETEKYIFVHSWIPTDTITYEPWHQLDKTKGYLEDWRNASDQDWEDAMWGNPFYQAKAGLNKTGKTIVFGHWHCSAGYFLNDNENKYSEFEENACWEPYINEEQGIIALDRCTAHTKEINVLVLEDNFIENLNN